MQNKRLRQCDDQRLARSAAGKRDSCSELAYGQSEDGAAFGLGRMSLVDWLGSPIDSHESGHNRGTVTKVYNPGVASI